MNDQFQKKRSAVLARKVFVFCSYQHAESLVLLLAQTWCMPGPGTTGFFRVSGPMQLAQTFRDEVRTMGEV